MDHGVRNRALGPTGGERSFESLILFLRYSRFIGFNDFFEFESFFLVDQQQRPPPPPPPRAYNNKPLSNVWLYYATTHDMQQLTFQYY
jgi:hypothetical protein